MTRRVQNQLYQLAFRRSAMTQKRYVLERNLSLVSYTSYFHFSPRLSLYLSLLPWNISRNALVSISIIDVLHRGNSHSCTSGTLFALAWLSMPHTRGGVADKLLLSGTLESDGTRPFKRITSGSWFLALPPFFSRSLHSPGRRALIALMLLEDTNGGAIIEGMRQKMS